MGLKDLKSTLDASILGVEGNTIANATPDANFNTLNGTSDSPFNSKSGDHMVDLLSQNVSSTNTGETYQNAPTNSPYQDLDGVQGPQFQRELTIASQVHESSLSLVPGGSQNSPYQDMDGGLPLSGEYLNNLPS